jgi:hypothetical protein
MGFEYSREQCGSRFLAYKLADNMVRLCSNKCERGRTAAQQRAWREANTRQDHFRQYHRACEYCGVATDAARATKRFCSDLCRTRAHNQRRREAADD